MGDNVNRVTLKSGVVLKIIPIPEGIIPEVMGREKGPEVPMVWIPEKGRAEENPSDPIYLRAVNIHEARLASVISDVIVLFGTEFGECPEGLEGPDGPVWREKARLLGTLKGESQEALYLGWVKHVAARTEEDFAAIMGAVGAVSGVSEAEVQKATARFPR